MEALLRDCILTEQGENKFVFSAKDPVRKSELAVHLSDEPKQISITGRIARIRKKSNKMCFILLRDEDVSLQVLFMASETVTRDYIKDSVAKIPAESVVKITGIVVQSPVNIDSATLSKCEMKGETIEVISQCADAVPIQVYQPDAGLDARLNNRCLDLRTIRNQLIFQVQTHIVQKINTYLTHKKFNQIFTPKIMAGVSESGSEVFKLDYFGQQASLAQSPQLFKQMAINSGFGGVFEIGPVFRAEKSDGSRHLTQYTSVDMEMQIKYNYHEVTTALYEMLCSIFNLKEDDRLLELVNDWKKYNPEYQMLQLSDKPIVISYKDCVTMLTESEYGCERPEDINHQDEFNLGKLIKKKYETDIFIIDEYPEDIRPFYSYVNEDGTTRSYDFVMRGCEILSGAQRINDYETLLKRAETKMGDISSISSYLDSFKYGSPPHGGGAFGLERLIARYLNVDNVRETTLFPRDPSRLVP